MDRQTEKEIALEAFMQELVQPPQPAAAEEEITFFPDDDGDGDDYDPFMIVAE